MLTYQVRKRRGLFRIVEMRSGRIGLHPSGHPIDRGGYPCDEVGEKRARRLARRWTSIALAKRAADDSSSS